MDETALGEMLLTLDQMGPSYSGFQLLGDQPTPNDEVIQQVAVPAAEAKAVRRFGRVTGLVRRFAGNGLVIHVAVNLHATDEGARGYARHVSRDIRASVGRTHPNGALLLRAEAEPVEGIGEQAEKGLLELKPPPAVMPGTMYITTVSFTRGPIIGVVGIERPKPAAGDGEPARIARVLDVWVQTVLQASDRPPSP